MNKLSVMLISVLLTSCAKNIPIPPPDIEDCAILSRNDGSFYLHCIMLNDSTKEWELTIPQGHSFTCISPDSREKVEKYAKELESWAGANCKPK